MKSKRVYCCEYCDAAPFDTETDAEAHEATHFGLTVKLYREWRDLFYVAKHTWYRLGTSHDQKKRKKFEQSIERICIFEKEHGLYKYTRPSHF